MKDLLDFEPANTTRGLADYSRVLEGVIGQVDIASTSYQELASRLREVNNLMAGVPIETMGPATVLDSRKLQLKEQSSNVNEKQDATDVSGVQLVVLC